jgi:hypothetical protein
LLGTGKLWCPGKASERRNCRFGSCARSRFRQTQVDNLLTLKTTDFASGGLEPSVLPAPVVGPFSQTVFGVKSTGIAMGVVGSVTYESDGIDMLLCGFNNPFVGSDAVNVTLTGSLAPALSCRAVISSGNHAAANFVLFDTRNTFHVLSETQGRD